MDSFSSYKRKSDILSDNDDDGDNYNSPVKSPESDDSYHCSKRRKVDLNSLLFEEGYEGTKEDLEKLPKRQKKRLLRKLVWQRKKPIRRNIEKEKKKLKDLINRMNGIQIISRKQKKNNSMANSNCKVTLVIDLSFDDLMSDKDMNKCMKQINRCYCANRSVNNPLQFHVTNLDGVAKKVISKNDGYKNWDVNFHEDSYLNVFNKEDLVYLTSDSDNVIGELDATKVYIIGGIVDHNSHKNLCYRIACDQGIAHGRLPLEKYLEMKTRRVLAINHVFEIMLFVAGGMSWKEAFLKVIPLRKGALPKPCDINSDDKKEQKKK
ncbi:tRNA methyltransferase 10 homolog A isoform X1 [Lycorma delicatula]|uniref:tRNA methyltransferase 10 homolog A isoform X1 n=1 Tax=Lycorma delicatula TaxID=130591 RepID=UPI003F518307